MSIDQIKAYCQTVCEQIRWKKAHKLVEHELTNHILDQRNAFIEEGMPEEEASKQAVLEMGDPTAVGLALDKTHRPRPQWAMLLLTMFLLLSGLIIRLAAAPAAAALSRKDMIMMLLAAVALFGAYLIDFTILAKRPVTLYLVVLFAGILLLQFSYQINSVSYFRGSGSTFFTSLSCLSLIFPLSYAIFIYAMRGKGYWGILICGAGYLFYACLLWCVPSASGFLLFTLAAPVLLCTAVIRGWFHVNKRTGLLMVLLPAALTLLACITYLFTHQNTYYFARLQAVMNQNEDINGMGYIGHNIRMLLSGCRVIGHGTFPVSAGDVLMLTEPNYKTDYILLNVVVRFGWLPALFLCLIFLLFIILGFSFILKQRSVLGLLVSLSVMMTYILQIVTYVCMNFGIILVSPISLPFISSGNTALILNSLLTGFMLSVFRTGDAVYDQTKVSHIKYVIRPDSYVIKIFRN